jgi:hypothetical protein
VILKIAQRNSAPQPLTVTQLAGYTAVVTLPGAGLAVTRIVGRAVVRRRGPQVIPGRDIRPYRRTGVRVDAGIGRR